MPAGPDAQTPPPVASESFRDAAAAVDRIAELYERNTAFLRTHFEAWRRGAPLAARVRAFYPEIRIATATHAPLDSRLSYGFVSGPGLHATTVTRPDLYRRYLLEQIGLLIQNHGVPVEIGESREPIPVHFAYKRDINLETEQLGQDWPSDRPLRDLFDVPDLAAMDDAIANGTHRSAPGEPAPLALFRAARTDYSLHRLAHYTGTRPERFQNFIVFTNYQFYVDAFARMARERMAAGDPDYEAFVEPNEVVTQNARLGPLGPVGTAPLRQPPMPAFHLVGGDHGGITMINIGTGPSNARNMTDHVAVLRPHAWMMLGHCAGLGAAQRLGDYVLAHGYVREDHVLDAELPLWVPIPALAEMQVALEQSVAEVTGLAGYELKRVMRTGTVVSVDNRNWELAGEGDVFRRLSQSRAIALDMESATIAANGFRFRVPYGTLLCVSDKPLHGEIKLAGMAGEFYRQRVGQHLEIGLKAVEKLRAHDRERLHSRKLRSFAEVAFQ
ncbi:AMP nucleosidase [Desertibaculum subflavum]|uniref:AMP nucleosidase n=1 Tax=Desertibaculum subflavum TaxID=2268458 RepID=UPI000E672346